MKCPEFETHTLFPDWDPCEHGRLLAMVTLGGADMHVDAIEVTEENGTQAVNEYLQDLLDRLLTMTESPYGFQTSEIDGGHYVVWCHPVER
jgi:hypothetical protein